MKDLTKLTRDEIGKWEWAAICRRLEQGDEWRAKYEETFAFYEDLRKQHDAMRSRLQDAEARCDEYVAQNMRQAQRLTRCEDENRKMNTTIAKDALEIWGLEQRLERCEAALKEIIEKAMSSPPHDIIWAARAALEGK